MDEGEGPDFDALQDVIVEEMLRGPYWSVLLLTSATKLGEQMTEVMQDPDGRLPDAVDELGETMEGLVQMLAERLDPIIDEFEEAQEAEADADVLNMSMLLKWTDLSLSQASDLLDKAHELTEQEGSWQEIGNYLASALYYTASTICYLHTVEMMKDVLDPDLLEVDELDELDLPPPPAPRPQTSRNARVRPPRPKKDRRGKKRRR